MTNGDNLDYLFISWLTMGRDLLNPFRWRFPIGYPYLLSGWLWLAGQRAEGDFFTLTPHVVMLAKFLGIGLLVPSFVAIMAWLRQVKCPMPFLAGLLLATSQVLMVQFSIIGAEPLFIFFSFFALLLWERAGQIDSPPMGLWFGISLLTLAAILSRQIGMAIPVAALAYVVLFRKRHSRRWCVSALLAALVPLAFSVILTAVTNPTHFLHFFSNPAGVDSTRQPFLQILVRNLSNYSWALPTCVTPKLIGSTGLLGMIGLKFLSLPLMVALYAVLATGVFVVFQNPSAGKLSSLYLATSVFVIFSWPYIDFRFFAPLLPIMIWLTLTGIWKLGHALTDRFATAMTFLLVAWIAFQAATSAFAARKNLQTIWRLRDQPPWHPERYVPTSELDFAGLLDAGMWIGSHAPQNSRVVSSKALFVQVSSGCRTDYPANMDMLVEHAKQAGTPLYVVWDSFAPEASYGIGKLKYIRPHLERQNSPFSEVYVSPYLQTRVYQLHHAVLMEP